jgi:hypothetical protein
MMGTPKTLASAIQAALVENGAGAAVGTHLERMIVYSVRDFLAQRFGAAMLKAGNPFAEKRLQDLFISICGPPHPPTTKPT